MPLGDASTFRGVIDLVDMSVVEWDTSADALGHSFTRRPLTSDALQKGEEGLVEAAAEARAKLVEQIAEVDEQIGEAYLNTDGATGVTDISPEKLKEVCIL